MDEFALLKNVFGVEEPKPEPATEASPMAGKVRIVNSSDEEIAELTVLELKAATWHGPSTPLPVQAARKPSVSTGVLRLFSFNGKWGVSLKVPGSDPIVLGHGKNLDFEASRPVYRAPAGELWEYTPGEPNYRCDVQDFEIDLARASDLLRVVAIQQESLQRLSRRSDPQVVEP